MKEQQTGVLSHREDDGGRSLPKQFNLVTLMILSLFFGLGLPFGVELSWKLRIRVLESRLELVKQRREVALDRLIQVQNADRTTKERVEGEYLTAANEYIRLYTLLHQNEVWRTF